MTQELAPDRECGSLPVASAVQETHGAGVAHLGEGVGSPASDVLHDQSTAAGVRPFERASGMREWAAESPGDLAETGASLDHPSALPEGGPVMHSLTASDSPSKPPSRPAMPRMVALLIAAQLRREAEEAATKSRDFGRGIAHAAATVERIAAAMGRD